MIRLSARRVRSLAAYCETEKELIKVLRKNKIPFRLEPEEIRIPSRKGMLSACRIRSRFEIHNTAPVPFRPDMLEV